MFVFQDPGNPDSTYLLESLSRACDSASKFAGAFAYSSVAGVNLVAKSPAFLEIANNHEVDLVVGIDGVTTTEALDALLELANSSRACKVRAFLNPRSDAIFHPKFCWTRKSEGGVLITGSGNLTERALLNNWEAYLYLDVDSPGLNEIESTWESWLSRHAINLRDLNDSQVRERVSANTLLAQEGDLPTLRAAASEATQQNDQPIAQAPADVLIAEIPKSGDRWKQANFHKTDYEQYFGALAGEQRLVVFRHVEQSGQLSPYEQRSHGVVVKSQNYRFELDAAKKLEYPDPVTEGRPIGVYLRVATRAFWYHLLMPKMPGYDVVLQMLAQHLPQTGARKDEMRSIRMTSATLRQQWPTAPFWRVES